jgi:metal-dependent amidase/aminoacylase/carboxypeptidase family protein
MQVITAQRLSAMEVTVHGQMAHAAIPESGVDALQAATKFWPALRKTACIRPAPGVSHI